MLGYLSFEFLFSLVLFVQDPFPLEGDFQRAFHERLDQLVVDTILVCSEIYLPRARFWFCLGVLDPPPMEVFARKPCCMAGTIGSFSYG